MMDPGLRPAGMTAYLGPRPKTARDDGYVLVLPEIPVYKMLIGLLKADEKRIFLWAE